MSDYKWVLKLIFFADFSEYLNKLNVKLYGSGKALYVTFVYIKAFEKKLEVFKNDIGDERFKYRVIQKSPYIENVVFLLV